MSQKPCFPCAAKLSASTKDTSSNVSAGQRTDGKEESELKEEEKKETTSGAAEEKTEESNEEAKPDSKVKEEKPGESAASEADGGISAECRWKHKVLCFLRSDGEKSAEEKEKDKEAPAATEATDVKDKSEAADMKKGTRLSLYPRLAGLRAEHARLDAEGDSCRPHRGSQGREGCWEGGEGRRQGGGPPRERPAPSRAAPLHVQYRRRRLHRSVGL